MAIAKKAPKADSSTALARRAEPLDYAILSAESAEIAEAFAENAGDDRISAFDLDRITVPSGSGAAMWRIPTLDGEEALAALEGVIIFQRTTRAYWQKEMGETGGSSPPDCSSEDGLLGVGNPGGTCKYCPLAAFGSGANGRKQACKQAKLLFVLRPESAIPVCVTIPPSSLGAIKKYMLRLSGFGVPYYGAVTSLSLSRTKNVDGIDYFEVVPSVDSVLSKDDTARLREVKERLEPILAAVKIDQQDSGPRFDAHGNEIDRDEVRRLQRGVDY